MTNKQRPIVMEEVTDAVALDEARAQREQFDRNSAWLQANVAAVYSKHRGKCVCIAGEELFVADTAREALAKATAAHPDDKGRFVQYIPKDIEMFAVIVDRPNDLVSLVGQRHRYVIETA